MRLDLMMLADAATAGPEGKLFIHGGGISRISAPMLPWTQPHLGLVARFEMDADDYDRPHEFQLAVTGPGNAVMVPPAQLPIPPQHRPDAAEGEELYMNIALGLATLTFTQEGVYRFELRMDGTVARSLPLAVVAARIDNQGALQMPAPRQADAES